MKTAAYSALAAALIAIAVSVAGLTFIAMQPKPKKYVPPPPEPRGVCITTMTYDEGVSIVTGIYPPIFSDGVLNCATGNYVSTLPIK